MKIFLILNHLYPALENACKCLLTRKSIGFGFIHEIDENLSLPTIFNLQISFALTTPSVGLGVKLYITMRRCYTKTILRSLRRSTPSWNRETGRRCHRDSKQRIYKYMYSVVDPVVVRYTHHTWWALGKPRPIRTARHTSTDSFLIKM